MRLEPQALARLFSAGPTFDRLVSSLEGRTSVSVTGVVNAARALFGAELAARLRRPVVLVLSDPNETGPVALDGRTLGNVPASVLSPADLTVVEDEPELFVTDSYCLESPAPEPVAVQRQTLVLSTGLVSSPANLVEWLDDAGYERVNLVTEPGEYALRGGIVDVFPEGAEAPIRCEFLNDVIASLRTFDALSQRSVGQIASTSVITRHPPEPSGRTLVELLPPSWVIISETPIRAITPRVILTADQGADFDFGCLPAPSYCGNFGLLRTEIVSSGRRYFIACSTKERCARVARVLMSGSDANRFWASAVTSPVFIAGPTSAGFANQRSGYVMLTERELFGVPLRQVVRHRFKGVPIDNLVALRPGDYVVHINHGIGRFEGVRRLSHGGVEKDYLELRYRGNDRVYVPVENLGMLDRYIGSARPVELDRIGGRSWLLAKARAARASAEYAAELLELAAQRSLIAGTAFPPDSDWQAQLEASFPYTETPDQLAALAAVKTDMERPRPMERLVAGDVGYGKTEIALRAALKAVAGLKQVAVLVPTTILCYQHYVLFRQRLDFFPVRVEMLSRFVAPARRRQIIADIEAGKVDIVIGTHLLLSSAVRFRDLGLLVVDEEQKFGVRQKEGIKRLKASVDVLTLTATPVPRTLYLALIGLRDISTINTPPPGRREVLTEVASWSDDLVVRYVEREVNRGGQVFFVHNRIASLPAIVRRLERLFPDLDICVAHGQMPERELAEIYLDFAAGRHQMLVSTAIIESGLDLPNVNTIIVDRADQFGLADLHQLRGRVGRSGRQAYALFVVPGGGELPDEARKRLSVLMAYSRLGSGFLLALRDLELRGAGDILGTRQHGHVARVGLNLYAQMLREAAARLKGETVTAEPELSLDVGAFIPEAYVPGSYERVALYRRLLGAADETELEDLSAELEDRFGQCPAAVLNLLKIARVRTLARRLGLLRVELRSGQALLVGPDRTVNFPATLDTLLARLQTGTF